jgi:hypothetical protein
MLVNTVACLAKKPSIRELVLLVFRAMNFYRTYTENSH